MFSDDDDGALTVAEVARVVAARVHPQRRASRVASCPGSRPELALP
jgi:hypothetical protein